MKSILYKISTSLLASLVLLSTVSFTIDKHFCCDELMDLAIFSSAEDCGMVSHDYGDEDTIVAKVCCENHQTFIQGQDELVKVNNLLGLEQVAFIATFTFSYIGLFAESTERVTPFQYYTSPLLVQDIH
ncbi:hypothetical protein RM549_19060, partial [Salegentibacter sp. F188]